MSAVNRGFVSSRRQVCLHLSQKRGIGEVPMDVQVKLLRVLQEREFERVGGTNPIKVDVRVIAATNRDLAKSIREGKFREDLFYRLNVFPIALPPLRDREGDVPLLAHFLVARFAARIGVRIESVGKATMERLSGYPWPGIFASWRISWNGRLSCRTARRWSLIRKCSPR